MRIGFTGTRAGMSTAQHRQLADVLRWLYMVETSQPEFQKAFTEHVETVSQHARAEVNAHIQATITRAGLAALGAPAPIELMPTTEEEGK